MLGRQCADVAASELKLDADRILVLDADPEPG